VAGLDCENMWIKLAELISWGTENSSLFSRPIFGIVIPDTEMHCLRVEGNFSADPT